MEYFNDWVTQPRTEEEAVSPYDPSDVPHLDVDRDSYVVLEFARMLPEAILTPDRQRGDNEHRELMKSVAREHGLIRLEAFQLIAPQAEWHRAYVIEVPTIEAAEAVDDAEMANPSLYLQQDEHLPAVVPSDFKSWQPGRLRYAY